MTVAASRDLMAVTVATASFRCGRLESCGSTAMTWDPTDIEPRG